MQHTSRSGACGRRQRTIVEILYRSIYCNKILTKVIGCCIRVTGLLSCTLWKGYYLHVSKSVTKGVNIINFVENTDYDFYNFYLTSDL